MLIQKGSLNVPLEYKDTATEIYQEKSFGSTIRIIVINDRIREMDISFYNIPFTILDAMKNHIRINPYFVTSFINEITVNDFSISY